MFNMLFYKLSLDHIVCRGISCEMIIFTWQRQWLGLFINLQKDTLISVKEDLQTGIETMRTTVRQLETQNQELQRQSANLDKDLLAERAMKEQKIKVKIWSLHWSEVLREIHRIEGKLFANQNTSLLACAGLDICHEGGRRADSPAPQAAAAVSADCPGAGPATQGTHKQTLKCFLDTSVSLRTCPVKRLDWWWPACSYSSTSLREREQF